MRKLLVLVAASLLVATVANAQPVDYGTYNVTLQVNGSSTVDWADIQSGFRLDVVLDASDPMYAAGVQLTGDSGFCYDAMYEASFYGGWVKTVSGYTDNPSTSPGNAAGWTNTVTDPLIPVMLPAGCLPMGGPLAGGGIAELGTLAGGAGAGQLGHLIFSSVPDTSGPVLTTWTIDVLSSYVGNETNGNMALGTATPLTILNVPIPEPASALLLLAGLPFLRRRR